MLKEETISLLCRTMKLNLLLAKQERMILKNTVSLKKQLISRVLRSVDFRDWQIFKIYGLVHLQLCYLEMGGLWEAGVGT